MKLAVVVGLSADRRRGQVLSGISSLDDGVKQLKAMIVGGLGSNPQYPIEAVAELTIHREHKFREFTTLLGEVELEGDDAFNALLAANTAMKLQIDELNEQLQTLREAQSTTDASNETSEVDGSSMGSIAAEYLQDEPNTPTLSLEGANPPEPTKKKK